MKKILQTLLLSLATLCLTVDAQYEQNPVNRLKDYYPAPESDRLEPLNQEEVQYAKKLLLEDNIDVINQIDFYYCSKDEIAYIEHKSFPKIVIGKLFYNNSEKAKSMILKHELGHFVNGDTTRTIPRTPAVFGIGWLSTSLKRIYLQRKEEYAADAYAARNCPDISYIKAEIKLQKKTANSFKTASPEDLRDTAELPIPTRLIFHMCVYIADKLRATTLGSLLIDPAHPTAANRIKRLKAIKKKIKGYGK